MTAQRATEALRIRDALQQAHAAGVDRLDAQWLLAHVLQTSGVHSQPLPVAPTITRSWLLAHDDQPLTDAQTCRWQCLLLRRATGEPLAYVLGEQVFCGLRLQVSPAVLIPRPETEELVRWALECLAVVPSESPQVLDLGTGSGAVALAIKHAAPKAQVRATDNSPQALEIARTNAQRLGLEIQFTLSDWWAALPIDSVDLVVSNPPYIAPGDPHLGALQHEPAHALVAGGDGLHDLRSIIAGASRHLRPGAWLLLEHGHDQASAVQALLLAAGLQHAQTRSDLAGLARCTGAQRR